MIVDDVMVRNVITIPPEAMVEDAVKLMLERGISGLFVVDAAGELVGVMTEGDLLRREELGTQRHRPWWLRMLVSPGREAEEFARANGRHVRDIMTPEVVSVAHDATLDVAVGLMEQHSVRRLPVTRGGHVVGVVSRSDLLRALLGRARDLPPVAADDSSIRTAILDALESKSWAPMTTLNLTVSKGVVDLWGTITNEGERHAIRVTAENTPGVTSVNDHLVYVEPYTGTVIEAPDDASSVNGQTAVP